MQTDVIDRLIEESPNDETIPIAYLKLLQAMMKDDGSKEAQEIFCAIETILHFWREHEKKRLSKLC